MKPKATSLKTFDEVQAKLAERQEHMENACLAAKRMCDEAELRGLTGLDVAQTVLIALAARDPDLAGDILTAVNTVIRRKPVTRIVAPGPGDPVH